MKGTKWVIPLALVLLVLALYLYKPLRVFAPAYFGVTCSTSGVCVDDETRRAEADRLLNVGLNSLRSKLGSGLSYKPRLIFCATQKCFESFGFDKASAQTVGTVATVIGPQGWEPYYLKHELIHHWQADKIGSFALYFAPQWIHEGMAYALSGDPRSPLSEPWESYRNRFLEWYSGIDHENLLAELKGAI